MGETYPKRRSDSVRKSFAVATLTVLTGLVLSGCSTAAPSTTITPESTVTQMKPAVEAPKLDSKQEASLRAEFKKISPALDNRRSIETARQQCRVILQNRPEEAQLAFAKKSFRNVDIKSVESPDETAKKIIAVIKSNGFCKAAE